MFIQYARRCINATDDQTYKKLHGFGQDGITFCGKELTHMWFIENYRDYTPNDISCRECRKLLSQLNIIDDSK